MEQPASRSSERKKPAPEPFVYTEREAACEPRIWTIRLRWGAAAASGTCSCISRAASD